MEEVNKKRQKDKKQTNETEEGRPIKQILEQKVRKEENF